MLIKITIDPGHGGSDRANRGPSGYIEADGVLDISLRLKSKLISTGAFDIQLTRDKDMSLGLTQRGKMAANNKSDLFISEHTNAGPASASGTEVFYSVDLPGTKAFAAELSAAVASALGINDRGAKVNESKSHPGEDYYTVIDAAQDGGVPNVFLIESAFHSNPGEEKLLLDASKRDDIAEAQAKVICKHYSVTYPVASAPKPQGDEQVKAIQELCNVLRCTDKNGHALAVDGRPGPLTQSAVIKLPVIKFHSNIDQAIRVIQEIIGAEVDGSFGPETLSKLKAWQAAHGLVADGSVGPKTWAKMCKIA